MDQLTYTVRRSNWINIIRQCQDRPAGTTAKQWLAENDISEKNFHRLTKSGFHFNSIPLPTGNHGCCGA